MIEWQADETAIQTPEKLKRWNDRQAMQQLSGENEWLSQKD
ncbi:hypothetical protein [Leptolyngbya sp. FACHB-17]|nr:hypothetical protein [Leptolyngbya sp. FACHB-17]